MHPKKHGHADGMLCPCQIQIYYRYAKDCVGKSNKINDKILCHCYVCDSYRLCLEKKKKFNGMKKSKINITKLITFTYN